MIRDLTASKCAICFEATLWISEKGGYAAFFVRFCTNPIVSNNAYVNYQSKFYRFATLTSTTIPTVELTLLNSLYYADAKMIF